MTRPLLRSVHAFLWFILCVAVVGCGGGGTGMVVGPTAPRIVVQPQSVAKLAGETATFTVTATGTAPLSYQWRRDGTAISTATSASFTTPALVIGDDGASFTVTVTDSLGSVTSTAAVLTVMAALTITSQPQDQTGVAGLTATFSVSADGTAPIAFQWRRNGLDIDAATGSFYTTPTLTASDSGTVYTVVLSNTVGSVTSAGAMLTVTPAQAGTGRYLVAPAGAPVSATLTWAGASATPFNSQTLLAAAAVSPTIATVVEAGGGATAPFSQVVTGTPAAGRISDLHTRYSFYFKVSDGTLRKIDHHVAAGSPSGTVLSTLTASQVCEGGSGLPKMAQRMTDDLLSPDANWRFFAAPQGGTCPALTESYLAVRASMSPTDAPVTVGEPLTAIYGASGAITGYVVRNGSSFQKLDANLTHPTTLFTMERSGLLSYGPSFGATAPGIWIFVNGDQVYAYDLSTQASAPTVIATLSMGEAPGQIVSDGESAYLSLANSRFGGYRILRVSSALTATTVVSDTRGLSAFSLTPTRIVLLTGPADPAALFSSQVSSVLHDGSGEVDVGGTSTGWYTDTVVTAAENVYLHEFQYDPSTFTLIGERTRIIDSDGSNAQTLPDTGVLGTLPAASLSLVRTLSDPPFGILLVDGLGADRSSAGATLRSVNAVTRAPLFSYGTVQTAPAGVIVPITADPLQYGQPGLLAFGPTTDSFNTTDLYYYDSDTAGSLARLTSFVSASSREDPTAAVRVHGRPK